MSLVKNNDFIVIEELYMMSSKGFIFYSSFHHELVDTEQVLGSKTKPLSTHHGETSFKITL